MKKLLTIVIPAYNMEKYLKYCLDSLCINQNSLEVLIINDGSKDTTSDIAHQYMEQYPHIFRVIDKANGNYGSCVNRGLTEAKGKYIKILDADDSFDTENFKDFLAFLEKTDADLVLSDFAVVDPERRIRKIIRYDVGKGYSFGIDEVCNTDVFKNMQMHAVTYRRENLLKLGYKQTEGISYTDQQWIFIPMTTIKSVSYFNRYVYKYLVGRAGQTMNPEVRLRSMDHTLRCALDMAKVYELYKPLFEGNPIQEYLHARIIPFIKEIYVSSLTHYDRKTKKLLTDFDNNLKETSKDIHELIGSKRVSSFKGFAYIDYWRNHKDVNKEMVKLLSRMYLLMLRMKRVSKTKNKMALPSFFN